MEQRLYLKACDLERLTGTSRRNCANILQQLRDALGKKKLPNKRYQEITIPEYCQYFNVPMDQVLKIIHVDLKMT